MVIVVASILLAAILVRQSTQPPGQQTGSQAEIAQPLASAPPVSARPGDAPVSAERAPALPGAPPPGAASSVAEPAETSALERIVEDDAPPGPDQHDQDEPQGLTISGAVLDDSGTLLPQIPVSARPAGAEGDGAGSAAGSSQQNRLTDRLGRFTFAGLEEGEYELVFAGTELHHPARERVRAGVANAELVLQRKLSLRVHGVVTDDAGNVLEGVMIRLLGEQDRNFTDSSGAYELLAEATRAGQAPVLDFSLEGYRDTRERVPAGQAAHSESVELNVRLEWEPDRPEVGVSGLVYGPGGEAVAGARVWMNSAEAGAYRKTRTDDAGEYRFESVRSGDAYLIGVEPMDGYASFESAALSIGPDDLRYDVQLEAQDLSSLSATVTDLDGTPLAGFSLWVRSLDSASRPPVEVQTDGAGGFRLEQVPAGALALESRSRPRLEAHGIVLHPGEARHVYVPLDWGQAWLFGQVVDDSGEPVPQARIILRWAREFLDVTSESRREVMSDLGGNFALSNLDASEYQLTVQATGYQSSRIDHRLGTGGQELRVTLPRLRASGALADGGH